MSSYHSHYQPPPGTPVGYQAPPGLDGQAQSSPPLFRTGLTNLTAKFHIRNVYDSNTSCLELALEPNGPVAYSAKMNSGSKLSVQEGSWVSGQPSVCTIEARHSFSQKSTIAFNGFESKIKETSQWHEGVAWPFEVDVTGHLEQWEWRRVKVSSYATLKGFLGMGSAKKLGTWELMPAGGGQVAATFTAEGGNTFQENAALGFVEFRGRALDGHMGMWFPNVVIAILLRIISQHYIASIAALAS
jgi:hypothetical protein